MISSLLSIVGTKTMTQSDLEEESFPYTPLISEGSQGRHSSMDLEAETKAETMEECCLPSYFSWLATFLI